MSIITSLIIGSVEEKMKIVLRDIPKIISILDNYVITKLKSMQQHYDDFTTTVAFHHLFDCDNVSFFHSKQCRNVLESMDDPIILDALSMALSAKCILMRDLGMDLQSRRLIYNTQCKRIDGLSASIDPVDTRRFHELVLKVEVHCEQKILDFKKTIAVNDKRQADLVLHINEKFVNNLDKAATNQSLPFDVLKIGLTFIQAFAGREISPPSLWYPSEHPVEEKRKIMGLELFQNFFDGRLDSDGLARLLSLLGKIDENSYFIRDTNMLVLSTSREGPNEPVKDPSCKTMICSVVDEPEVRVSDFEFFGNLFEDSDNPLSK